MAESDKEVTYSDDEFGSDAGGDYEAEYEEEDDDALLTHAADDDEAAADGDAETSGSAGSGDASHTTQPNEDQYANDFEESVDGTSAQAAFGNPAAAAESGEADATGGDADVGEAAQEDSVAAALEGLIGERHDRGAELPSLESRRIQPGVAIHANKPSEPAAPAPHDETSSAEQDAAENQPWLLGQLAKPASIRSLSVPVVPAASLVDPNLLVSSNLRSTSVPVVPSNEIIGIHRQTSGRFRIETVAGSGGAGARHKSITRLPSVEEFETQGAMDSDVDSEGESESEDADDDPPSAPLDSPRERSSSFRAAPPQKISPVLRTKSQPFMTRLPSVIEVTAEEILAIESMLDGGEGEKDEESGDDTNLEFSADEARKEASGGDMEANAVDVASPSMESMLMNPASDKQIEPEANSGSAAGAGGDDASETLDTDETGQRSPAPIASELQTEIPGGSVPSGALIPAIEPLRKSNEPDDEYDDEYDDQQTSIATEQQEVNPNDGADGNEFLKENHELLDDFDDFTTAGETAYNDDEYEGDSDNFPDVQLEEESRRETELLLHEAQLLIQKQHEDTSNSRALLARSKSESPDIPDTSDPADVVIETTTFSSAAAEDIAEEEDGEGAEKLVLETQAANIIATPATVEDPYGEDDDEFANADEEEDDADDDGFDPYASDHDNADDDVDGSRNPSNATSEQTLSAGGADIPMETSGSTLVSNAAAEDDITHSQSNAAQTDPSRGSQSVPKATHESIPPLTASDDCPHKPGNAEQNVPRAINGAADNTKPPPPRSKPNGGAGATAVQKPAARTGSTRPSRPAAATAPSSTPSRASRLTRPVTERRNVEIAESVLKRERPRELRLKTQRAAAPTNSTQASSDAVQPPTSVTRPQVDALEVLESKDALADSATVDASSQPTMQSMPAATVSSPPGSPDREARRSPERTPAYTPRVYVEEYEPPPPKAPIFRQKRAKKPKTDDSRRKLLPVKSPPNLRIDLPSMDKTKRNWLFLNMFRHGDDVSKYESFVPQLVSPGLPQSAANPMRPRSALQQTYASSQADAIAAYGAGRGSRNGRRLVQQQQDPALRERELNWAPTKPHESAIPAYDSILDKFCTTVTSPVIQRQIYQTRQDDLSPQLAYVLEKRVEKQWKNHAAEAFGAASLSYKTEIVHSPSSIDKKSPNRPPCSSTSPSM